MNTIAHVPFIAVTLVCRLHKHQRTATAKLTIGTSSANSTDSDLVCRVHWGMLKYSVEWPRVQTASSGPGEC